MRSCHKKRGKDNCCALFLSLCLVKLINKLCDCSFSPWASELYLLTHHVWLIRDLNLNGLIFYHSCFQFMDLELTQSFKLSINNNLFGCFCWKLIGFMHGCYLCQWPSGSLPLSLGSDYFLCWLMSHVKSCWHDIAPFSQVRIIELLSICMLQTYNALSLDHSIMNQVVAILSWTQVKL